MIRFLLLFLSTMCLLFALPKHSSLRSFAQQGEFRKSCNHSKRFVKRNCAKKCLKHQTHPEKPENAANLASGCNQQLYAIHPTLPAEPAFALPAKRVRALSPIRKHLSPDLDPDPDPPRFS